MRFSNSITIQRPLHEVFAFVSDLENVPKWNYAIVETRKTSEGVVGVGTTFRQIRSIPSVSEEALRVTDFEPDRRFEFEGSLGPFRGTLLYEFDAVDGATRLINTADLEVSGIMALALPIASGRIREAVAKNLSTLKQLLEREG